MTTRFEFKPRWKEELVVSFANRSVVLVMPMGITSVYLPTEDKWQDEAPEWARALYGQLRTELEDWCGDRDVRLYIDTRAGVYSA